MVYARAGIPTYVIVNVLNRTIGVYGDPNCRTGRYRESSILSRTDRVRIPAVRNRRLIVPVKQFVP